MIELTDEEMDKQTTIIFVELDNAVRLAIKKLKALGDDCATEAVYDHIIHMDYENYD